MSKNTEQQQQLEMGSRRSRSPAHEGATQSVAPKPAAGLNNDVSNSGSNSSSQICSNKPAGAGRDRGRANILFVADQLNAERRVVLQLREGCSLKKIHAAFEIFNVAATVASFCPLPPFELKSKLLHSFKEYVSKGKQLSTADHYALSRVTSVGDSFLSRCGCSGLKTIDLSPVSNVTNVGYSFLYQCSDLNSIDLSPLSNLTTVANGFLWNCTGLETIDLTPLSNVTSVGFGFLCDCNSLQTIDLSSLSNLTTVGDEFLYECSGLDEIDLSPLSKLTTVGDEFLVHCSGLSTIDLSPLSNVTTVGDRFLYRCSYAVQAQRKKFLER